MCVTLLLGLVRCWHGPHESVPLQALKSFNSGLAKNSSLRQQIDHLRQEREVFESMYKKLQKVCVHSCTHSSVVIR